MTQEQALTILKTGANVFLTGEPGAGKTYTINQYVAWLRERGVEPAITASTGIAATHIGGMTIHAWSGVGIRHIMSEWELEGLLERESLVRRVRSAHILIIDEVSMLDATILSLVDSAVRTIKQSSQPFGGMQVIFVGDFFQLPPVTKSEQHAEFAFASATWEAANPVVCYLTEQHRQDDDTFLEILSAMRGGTVDTYHHELLQARAQVPTEQVTQLYPHNANVDQINTERLSQLDQQVTTYQMTSQGSKNIVDALKRGCLSPEVLTLKVGATVMCTRNNFEAGYVNGTLGTITGFSAGGYPTIKTRDGKMLEIEPVEWRVEDGKRILAKITQVPLRLAWAITVHKSQGMSLDAAQMDLSQAFEYGQGYVALSRVRRLSGLYLSGFNQRALEVHPEVAIKDSDFRRESDLAAATFGSLPTDELTALQKNFVVAIGGKDPADVKKDKADGMSKIEKLRSKHPNAYKSWSADDDARLTEMFRDEAPVAQLVKEFGRQRGAINSRLIRLGLVEPDL